jgi:hypothetical protein
MDRRGKPGMVVVGLGAAVAGVASIAAGASSDQLADLVTQTPASGAA